jgi:hypothetical protein
VPPVRCVRGDTVLKSSIARFIDMERLAGDLRRKAYERAYRTAGLQAFIGDGSHWIRSPAEVDFPHAEKTPTGIISRSTSASAATTSSARAREMVDDGQPACDGL